MTLASCNPLVELGTLVSMRTNARTFAGLIIAAAGVLLLPAVPAAAADTSPPQLVDVQLSSSSFTVSGFARTTIQVRLHLTDDTHVVRGEPDQGTGLPGSPWVQLSKTTAGRGQVTDLYSDEFSLTSGTAQDGWWSAPLRITSGYDGTWTVTRVRAADGNGNFLDVDPRTQSINATMQVTGAHIPHLSMRQTPDPEIGDRNPITFYGHVTDLDTAQPLRATVHMGFDAGCSTFPYGGASHVTTAADGSWRLSFSSWQPDAGCASLYNFAHVPDPDHAGSMMTVQIFYVDFVVAPHYRWPVSASLAAHLIKLGETTTVNGSTGAIGETVQLERLSHGSWTIVGSAHVRTSGRFTLIAEPPSRGNWRYRVLLWRTIPGEQASSSRVLLLGVT